MPLAPASLKQALYDKTEAPAFLRRERELALEEEEAAAAAAAAAKAEPQPRRRVSIADYRVVCFNCERYAIPAEAKPEAVESN